MLHDGNSAPKSGAFVGCLTGVVKKFTVMSPLDKDRQQLLSNTRVDFFKSSGPGGQRKNKVETAVRLVHQPTGITVIARERRSRARNLQLAIERLALRLEAAARRPSCRIPTAPPAGARQRILERKRRRGAIKRMREKVRLNTV